MPTLLVGLQQLSRLTALQVLTIDSNRAVREREMIRHVRPLVMQHSLATINVSPFQVSQGLGQDLTCKWRLCMRRSP